MDCIPLDMTNPDSAYIVTSEIIPKELAATIDLPAAPMNRNKERATLCVQKSAKKCRKNLENLREWQSDQK